MNGNFNVSLEPYNDTGSRFYRFVQALHFDYGLFHNNKPMKMLNEERISTLVHMGFQFQ